MKLFGNRSSGEVLESQEVTAMALAKVFKDAFMDVTVESDGDLKIKDVYNAFVSTDEKSRFIRFRVLIRCSETADDGARLKYTNSVNTEFIVVRATDRKSAIVYDYYLIIEGGVTKKNIVLTFRKFMPCVGSAVAADSTGVLA